MPDTELATEDFTAVAARLDIDAIAISRLRALLPSP
jgi:hypothetical protein